MQSDMLIAMLSLLGTAIGSIGGILVANKLSNYRIAMLEKKVDKHNGVMERMALAEEKIRVINHRIDDLEE